MTDQPAQPARQAPAPRTPTPSHGALWTQILNTVVSIAIIVAVTFLAADHILQVGTVSAIFVTLIAHQFGSFTIGRRADDQSR